jgi:hypothetical protein
MTLKARLDKLRFLAADMRLAYRMSTFAPTDADARMLVRHVIIRAESFIEHARAIRKPPIAAGFDVRAFHKTKENYAAFFAEYFRVARDRLSAHVQDLDFGRRIELWNDIDASKSEFFADGAVEIYRLLECLAIPGIETFADPQAWLADVLARIAAHPAHRLDELLPWNWKEAAARLAA